MTHFTDSMPIISIGGMWFVDLWNPKYAAHIFKVTVAVDMLGNMIWTCPLAPGTSADVLIWDRHGNNHVMMCMDGTGPESSNCLLICGIGV